MLWQRYAEIKPTDIALKFELKQQVKSGDETRFSIVERDLTWRDLHQLIEQWADVWQAEGVSSGEGVALIGRYQPELVIAYLVALRMGCRVLVINPMLPAEKIIQICEQCNMDYLLDCTQLNVNSLEVGKLQQLDFGLADDVIQQRLATKCPLTFTLTSGSTGLPKAVVHTLSQHLASAEGISPLLQIDENSEWLLALPLFHVSGQGIVWRWLQNGCCLRCVGDNIYQNLLQVTHSALVPTQLQHFLYFLQENKISSFRLSHILLGGAHIPVALTQQAIRAGIHCYSGYGMTEAASTVFAKKSDVSAGVGYLLPLREYRLVDGEIWVRGQTLALGCWQKNGEIKTLLNQEGWFATRDKGYQAANTEELFIQGRIDNMFISGGENIQPEEIEAFILQQPDVKQVFVLPIEDQIYGQRPVAVIDFANGFSFDKVNAVQVVLREKLEKFKQPIAYYPFEKIMRSALGIKVSRHLLSQQLSLFLQNSEE
ncbi:O-succinylbenzoic acid--CoA ligase [Gallibacterium anatis]|uniref:o-succinylbenzoate--CoA ligase n=1 Tax=Gallibacterium anatis TaxID=750 RepID=UPI0005312BC9|nr:o-succinylbenzoate--CoA ligase [Gallibacterium anatis]KGQ52567.1 O-succinylbenzoic acid--CoA ligase [Gallibacterium anatis]